MLESILDNLRALVAFDTRNPPRAISAEGGLFAWLAEQLPGFEVRVEDHGAGAVSLYAQRGQPRRLFNVHLDTVPDSPAWSADPFTLRVDGERAVGLGACDIKGAAAALLAVARATPGDLALLFTSDEEANDARGVAAFLRREHGFSDVVVAEPTGCRAVLAHRGLSAARVQFHGEAGHASAAAALEASALHQAMRWGTAALDFVAAHAAQEFGGLQGLRFNIGRVEGGIKANVIAPHAEVRFGFRPLPSQDSDELHRQLRDFAATGAEYEETFRGPSLPAGQAAEAENRRRQAEALAEELGLEVGPAVDFWTEASLFSQAGFNAIVYGPGDIAQAHAADEWVELAQLQRYAESIRAMLMGQHT